MTTETDTRFGRVHTPSSIEKLMSLVCGSFSEPAPVRMWRGHPDDRWLIHSAAYRKLTLDSGNPTEADIASYEQGLLSRATHRGYRNFEGRVLSDFELLARLQHHGAATRLIDTSRNA